MQKRLIKIILMVVIVFLITRMDGKDWPQLQGNAAHTGYIPEEGPRPPFSVKWARDLGEPFYPSQQNIIAEGKLFIGTGHGNLYALNIQNGKNIWIYKTKAPILGSAAFNNGIVYVNSSDRFCHAVDSKTGKVIWRFETEEPLWAAPVVADGKVFIGGRDGFVYAVDAKTGKQLWKSPIGGQVMSTPAYADKVIYVPAGDMHVYAYNAKTGKQLWKSVKLPGQALRDTWLVVSHGCVLLTTQQIFHNNHMRFQKEAVNPWVAKHKNDPVLVEDEVFPEMQKWFEKNRNERGHLILDAKTGKEKLIMPIMPCYGGGSSPAPPAVDKDGWAYTFYQNIVIGASGNAFYGRFNLETNKFDPLLKDRYVGIGKFRGRPGHQPKTGNWPNGYRMGSFKGAFTVTDHAWATSIAGTISYPIREEGDRQEPNYFDHKADKDGFLINRKTKNPGKPIQKGNFKNFNHCIATPMAISGKMLFYNASIGNITAYEGR